MLKYLFVNILLAQIMRCASIFFAPQKGHLGVRLSACAFFVCTMLLMVPSAFAQAVPRLAWEPRIVDAALPERLVAVDKDQQQFYLFEKKSPLKLTLNYPCTTGQVEGDKQKINDKRTPEGVYFVEYKISSGLDFKEYGGIAYTLNYPNPVDKLRGKTGYGIWIHSKGEAIEPRITRGCIAIDLDNIAEVGPMLTPGTPVLVAENLAAKNVASEHIAEKALLADKDTDDAAIARHLRLRMEQWTRAWASRSEDFFDFYNQSAYTRAMPESFQAFRANKERLFKLLKWINIFNREVYVLEGPGYWVTWSEQFYRAPNLSTEGIRRLYWQRGKDEQFRIVGMEWIPRNVGMQAAYEKGQLVAKTENFATDAAALSPSKPEGMDDPVQGEKPLLPPLLMPEQAQPDTLAGTLPNILPDTLPDTLPGTPPASIKEAAPVPAPSAGHTTVAQLTQKSPSFAQASVNVSEVQRKALQKKVLSWAGAWQKLQIKELLAFYDAKNYGSVQGLAHKESYATLKSELTRRLHVPWVEIMQNPARVERHGDYFVTRFNQWVYTPGKMPVEGERVLYWRSLKSSDEVEDWRIVASRWQEKSLDMSVLYLEKVSGSVMSWVEDWRKDWLAANIDKYAAHYAPHARQGARTKTAMVRQKSDLWKTAAPAIVQLNGIRVQLDKDGVRVDMTQVYEDKLGRGDKGVKTLILQPHSKGPGQRAWRIVREEWEAQ